jgi:hypothetical protein
MSQRPISPSKDLRRLREAGYDITVQAGYLLVRDVPYVNSKREIGRGTLVTKLTLAGDVTAAPESHQAYFIGEHPCDCTGARLDKIANASNRTVFAEGLVIDHAFSSKPMSGRYADYYELMSTYVAIITSQAQAIDPSITAKTFPVVLPDAADGDSVFEYVDTASSRANIGAITHRLAVDKLAIVGVGGTGSFVLDFLAKTPAKEIHLYDGDRFLQHNAFRAPGAASREELQGAPNKATFFQALYSQMRKGIVAHPYNVDATNVEALRGASFVFICIDRSAPKKLLVQRLTEYDVPFVDVGMGIPRTDGPLGGIVRATTSTSAQRLHFAQRVSLADTDVEDEYDQNIQIAELNALNAALAVIKWKKLVGFYRDDKHEHHTTYTVAANMLLNEDDA